MAKTFGTKGISTIVRSIPTKEENNIDINFLEKSFFTVNYDEDFLFYCQCDELLPNRAMIKEGDKINAMKEKHSEYFSCGDVRQ